MRIRGFLVVAGCLLAVSLFAQPKYSDWDPPVNLGPVVNSPYQDFAPAISKDGLSLYFSSDRPVGSYGTFDIWVSERATTDDPWGAPKNLGPIVNGAYSDNSPALSRDEHWLFFNSTRPLAYGGVQDIWTSWRANTQDNFAWGPPFDLGPNINTPYLDTFPSYFENDDGGAPQLFFASNRPGGIRGADIYVSALMPTGEFGPPTLVRELSSTDGELRPSIRFDGLEIIFSRNPFGQNSISDLWASTRNSVTEPWSDPVNLGPVVNSFYQDSHPYLAPDRVTLYFCSDRDHPGDLDLYVTTRTKKHP